MGREYAGQFRPSMFVTLTCNTYGQVRDDGTPIDPNTYDARRPNDRQIFRQFIK